MSSNGRRRPPRPSLQVTAPGAGPEEAAAIAAALERFLHDTAPAPSAHRPVGGWERAALAEAVGTGGSGEWGEAPGWSS